MSRSCVVVGRGLAGLTAALRLANAGIRVTVLEAEPAVGRRSRSEKRCRSSPNPSGAARCTSASPHDRQLGKKERQALVSDDAGLFQLNRLPLL